MKNKNKIISLFISVSMILTLLFTSLYPLVAFAEEEIVYIESAEDLIALSKSCSYDAWSVGKQVVLKKDISLSGVDFAPIPSFSGSFDGAGHEISGLMIDSATAPAGLFAVLTGEALVKDLTLSCTVAPSGDGDRVGAIAGENLGRIEGCAVSGVVVGVSAVGGIVGINRPSGSISDCSVEGEIIGENAVGGIAGRNEGLISAPTNLAKVNTASMDSSLSLSDLASSLSIDLGKLSSIGSGNMTDIGGIAGYSKGFIMGCANGGDVGYPHVGYNIGGIAGRSSGHMNGNINTAYINGRKDVGGIVGQVEPNVSYELSEDLLAALKSELDALSSEVSGAVDSLDGDIPTISDRLDGILTSIEGATSSLEKLIEGMTELGNDAVGEINRSLEILSHVMDQLSGITADIPDITAELGVCLDSLEEALQGLSEISSLGTEAIADISLATQDMTVAFEAMSDGLEQIDSGLTLLGGAIEVQDEAAASEALDLISLGFDGLIDATALFASSIDAIATALEGAELDEISNITDAMGDMTTALSTLSGALTDISGGVKLLNDNTSFDLDDMSEGLIDIRDGISLLGDGMGAIGEAFDHITDALTHLESAGDLLPDTITAIKDSVASLGRAMDKFTDTAEKIDLLIGYLSSVDPIQLPTVSDSIIEDTARLFIHICDVEAGLKELNRDISSLSSQLVTRVGNMNDIFTRLSDQIVDVIYDLENGDIIDSEISEDEADDITEGRIFGCENRGDVYGDLNVGGIGGAMGPEYTLDPEEDISKELSLTQRKEYRLKAVIQGCVSYGNITAKRDYVGGIVGKSDIGLIYGSEAYGYISSEGGSYVGGIAGLSSGVVSDCYAKTTLSGNKYVGGIIGSGESDGEDKSCVKDCYAMVAIDKFTQYGGAVAGVNNGDYINNLFVSDTLSGIDRVSYKGKAEPISYEDLAKRKLLPSGFYLFTLRFMADGEELHSVDFEYGESIDGSVFPAIPEKAGHYGYWDITDLSDLKFDTTVSVVYKPYVTSIGSEELRDDGRHIFFLIGEFTEEDSFDVKAGCDTHGLVLEENLILKDRLVESWELSIPKDTMDVNRLHYLPESDYVSIYLKLDGVWTEVDASEFGSYLCFTADGETLQMAVVKSGLKISPILIVCIALIILQTVIIVVVVKRRGAKGERKSKGDSPKEKKKDKSPKKNKGEQSKKNKDEASK